MESEISDLKHRKNNEVIHNLGNTEKLESIRNMENKTRAENIENIENLDNAESIAYVEPYLVSPAVTPPLPPRPPQNLGIGALSRKYNFFIQHLLNNDHRGAWLASGSYLPAPSQP